MKKINCTLLVDDDDTANYINQILLEDMDISEKTIVAHNGKEAIEMIKKKAAEGDYPDLILLDINMPVMNGFDFLEAFDRLPLPNKNSIVIIMLSTSLNPKDVGRIKDEHIKEFLNKPLTEEMVKEKILPYFR